MGCADLKTPQELQEMLDVNSYSLCVLLRLLLPRINARSDAGKKSGVSCTSSLAGGATTGGNMTYHGTKVFIDFLVSAVRYELQQTNSKVEMYVLTPSSTDTTLMQ